jgi:hypothetical protein
MLVVKERRCLVGAAREQSGRRGSEPIPEVTQSGQRSARRQEGGARPFTCMLKVLKQDGSRIRPVSKPPVQPNWDCFVAALLAMTTLRDSARQARHGSTVAYCVIASDRRERGNLGVCPGMPEPGFEVRSSNARNREGGSPVSGLLRRPVSYLFED